MLGISASRTFIAKMFHPYNAGSTIGVRAHSDLGGGGEPVAQKIT